MRFIDMTPTHTIAVEALDAERKPMLVPHEVGVDWAIQHFLTNDASFNSDGAGIRASTRLENALLAWNKKERAARPQFLPVDQADWQLLVNAIENPRPLNGRPAYPVVPARRIDHLFEAVRSAPEKEPGEDAKAMPVTNGAAAQA